MSVILAAQRLRFAGNMYSHAQVPDLITGERAIIWRGTTLFVEVGIFVNAAIITSVAEIASLHLEILPGDDRNSAPIVTLLPDAALAVITSEQWTAGTLYNARFALTAAQTQLVVQSTTSADNKRSFWLVCHAVLATSSHRVTIFGTQFDVEEDGAQNDLAELGLQSPSRVLNGALYLRNESDPTKWNKLRALGLGAARRLEIDEEVSL